jgi:hypothetical protein
MYGRIQHAQLNQLEYHRGLSTAISGVWLDGGRLRFVFSRVSTASEICLSLLVQVDRLPASRAACTAGRRSATSTPMIAITTRSSTSVKALRRGRM